MRLATALFILFVISAIDSQAQYRFHSQTNQELQKYLRMECSETETACQEICETPFFCEWSESFLRNGIGYDVAMAFFWQNFPEMYQWQSLDSLQDVVDLLDSGNFISLHYTSFYNLLDLDPAVVALRWQAHSLACNFEDLHILVELRAEDRKWGREVFILCPNQAFRLMIGVNLREH